MAKNDEAPKTILGKAIAQRDRAIARGSLREFKQANKAIRREIAEKDKENA